MIDLNEIPGLPLDADGPVFPAPWAARAFAMTVKLSEAGLFAWSEWVAVFSAELANRERAPDRSTGVEDAYYACWVDSLEKMLAGKGIVTQSSLKSYFDVTLANWPEPDPVARPEPIARSLPIA